MVVSFGSLSRRGLLVRSGKAVLGCTVAGVASGLLLPTHVEAAGYQANNSNLNILSKTNADYSAGYYYLLWSDGSALEKARQVTVSGKAAGTQVGESSQCVAMVKTLTGAPGTSGWRRGRAVVGGNLPRGTAIAKFESDGTYSQTGAGHCGILIGLRSTGGFDLWDQNFPTNPSIIRRHTINGTGGGIYDPRAYYEII